MISGYCASVATREHLNLVWYERDKTEQAEPPCFWRAISIMKSYPHMEKMMLQLQESLDTLVERYHEQKWLLFHPLITPDLSRRLLACTTPLPVRTVICGGPNIRFGQQDVEETHPLARFFQGREIVDLVLATAGATRLQRCRCWTSVYGPGEYINAHRDRSGDIQLLICLQSLPEADGGGSLLLKPRTGEQRVFLTPGDAVLFEASGIEHATTPLLRTEKDPHPKPIVAVGCFFLDYHW